MSTATRTQPPPTMPPTLVRRQMSQGQVPSPAVVSSTNQNASTAVNNNAVQSQPGASTQSTPPASDTQTTQPVPVTVVGTVAPPKLPWYRGKTAWIMAFLSLMLAIAFGTGSWIGQNKGNQMAWTGLLFAKYGICADNEDIRDTPECQAIIAETLRTLTIHKDSLNHPGVQKRAEVVELINQREGNSHEYFSMATYWTPDQVMRYRVVLETLEGLNGTSDALTRYLEHAVYLRGRTNLVVAVVGSFGSKVSRLRSVTELLDAVDGFYPLVVNVVNEYLASLGGGDTPSQEESGRVEAATDSTNVTETPADLNEETVQGRAQLHEQLAELAKHREYRPRMYYDSETAKGLDSIGLLFLEPPPYIGLFDFLRTVKSLFSFSLSYSAFLWITSVIGFAALHAVGDGPPSVYHFSPPALAFDLCVMVSDEFLLGYITHPLSTGAALTFIAAFPAFLYGVLRRCPHRDGCHMTTMITATVCTLVFFCGLSWATERFDPYWLFDAGYWAYRNATMGGDIVLLSIRLLPRRRYPPPRRRSTNSDDHDDERHHQVPPHSIWGKKGAAEALPLVVLIGMMLYSNFCTFLHILDKLETVDWEMLYGR